MRKFLSVVLGFFILAGAAIVLWEARGPVASEDRVTGGVLYSQAEIAQESAGVGPNLSITSDLSAGEIPLTTDSVGAPPAIEGGALGDLSALDSDEIAAAPATTGELASSVTTIFSLTSDIVLDGGTDTVIVPLGGAAPANEGGGGPGGIAGGYQQRVVELEWPERFRVGGSGTVRVKLKLLSDGSLQPVAEIDSNQVLGTPILITDRFETHRAEIRADLSAPDFDIESVNQQIQPLERTSEPEWRWTLNARESGQSVIALGLTIHWIPRPEHPDAIESSATIWGQALQVPVEHVFGTITVPQASLVGAVLGVLGFLAEIPLLEKLLEGIWGLFFGRRRRRDDRRR